MGLPRTAEPTTVIFGTETETRERREKHEVDRLEKHTEQINKKACSLGTCDLGWLSFSPTVGHVDVKALHVFRLKSRQYMGYLLHMGTKWREVGCEALYVPLTGRANVD